VNSSTWVRPLAESSTNCSRWAAVPGASCLGCTGAGACPECHGKRAAGWLKALFVERPCRRGGSGAALDSTALRPWPPAGWWCFLGGDQFWNRAALGPRWAYATSLYADGYWGGGAPGRPRWPRWKRSDRRMGARPRFAPGCRVWRPALPGWVGDLMAIFPPQAQGLKPCAGSLADWVALFARGLERAQSLLVASRFLPIPADRLAPAPRPASVLLPVQTHHPSRENRAEPFASVGPESANCDKATHVQAHYGRGRAPGWPSPRDRPVARWIETRRRHLRNRCLELGEQQPAHSRLSSVRPGLKHGGSDTAELDCSGSGARICRG